MARASKVPITEAPARAEVQRLFGFGKKKPKPPTVEEFAAKAAQATMGTLTQDEFNETLDSLDARIEDLRSQGGDPVPGEGGKSKSMSAKDQQLQAERRRYEAVWGDLVLHQPDWMRDRTKQQASDIYVQAGLASSAFKDTAAPGAVKFDKMSPLAANQFGRPQLNDASWGEHIATEAARPGANGTLTEAELLSIYIYTASDYEYINPAVAGGASFGAPWRQAVGMDVDSVAYQEARYEAALAEEDPSIQLPPGVQQIAAEGRVRERANDEGHLHGGMLQSALAKLAPAAVDMSSGTAVAAAVPTFRGERMTPELFKARKTQWVTGPAANFISTSKDPKRAAVFRDPGDTKGGAKSVSVWYTLKLYSGRYVNSMSAIKGEEEVLVPIGTYLKYDPKQLPLPKPGTYWDSREEQVFTPDAKGATPDAPKERWHVDVEEVPQPPKPANTPATAATPTAPSSATPAAAPASMPKLPPPPPRRWPLGPAPTPSAATAATPAAPAQQLWPAAALLGGAAMPRVKPPPPSGPRPPGLAPRPPMGATPAATAPSSATPAAAPASMPKLPPPPPRRWPLGPAPTPPAARSAATPTAMSAATPTAMSAATPAVGGLRPTLPPPPAPLTPEQRKRYAMT